MSESLLEAANYHQTRRHYTFELPGGWGTSLCSNGELPTNVYSQDAQDKEHARWGSKALSNADLPLCKKCWKQAEKRGLEVVR